MSQKEVERLLARKILSRWESGKVMLVTGPRQVGKTTLVRTICEKMGDYLFINGDDPEDRILLEDFGEKKLRTVIGNHKILFIDEAQNIKDIGFILKIIHDRIPEVKVIASGSSVLGLYDEVQEPLTGRKWEFKLYPFSYQELNNHFGYAESSFTGITVQ